MHNHEPCYCPAYPFPHRPGGGKCRATGEAHCPSCEAVLADGQMTWQPWAVATRLYPAEEVPVLLGPCGRCGAVR